MQADTIRVWIDDPHPIFRRGLRTCLTVDELTVVGESSNFESCTIRDVDVLVFDARDGGLQGAVGLRSDGDVHLVAIVDETDERLLYEAVEASVSAIQLRRDLRPDSLVSCVRAAVDDSTTLPTDLVPRLLQRAATSGGIHPSALQPRELAVLTLLAEGDDTQRIAGELCYSERTVKNIVHDLLMKLNCRNRAHAVATATRQGII